MAASDNLSLSLSPFGKTSEGGSVVLVTMRSPGGCTAKLSSFGAALQSLIVKGRDGADVDVVLGYDSAEGYELNPSCFGSTMGRCTGRADGAEITVSGVSYALSENRRGYHMHGGFRGFHKRLWAHELLCDGVRFSLISPDGDEGYPGELRASVTYRWADRDTLSIEYLCVCDKDTAINLTNHSYFDLAGHGAGRDGAMGQELCINSRSVAMLDERGMINGAFMPVDGTALDFSAPHMIGERIEADFPLMKLVGGYDHNYTLSGAGMKAAAELYSPETGIAMAVRTELPMLGLYTANFLAAQTGKGGAQYGKNTGVCLETQFLPDCIKLRDYEPKPIFRAGEEYRFTTLYTFSVR